MKITFLLLITSIFSLGTNAQWNQLGADINGESIDDYCGNAVSLNHHGNIAAVGSYGNNDSGNNAGQVRIFEWTGNTWVQRGQDINGESMGDSFGTAVEIDSAGNTIAIGAPGNDGNGVNSGHVQVYEWDGSSWIQKGMNIDGEYAGDGSGNSLSISNNGDIVAIGAISNDDSGSTAGQVRVFEWDGTNWQQKGSDIDGENAGDYFGSSVSLSADGNLFVAGAINNSDIALNSGQVRVYEWNGSDWMQKGTDLNGLSVNGGFGFSVSMNNQGNTFATGIINGAPYGLVKVYEWIGNGWLQKGSNIHGHSNSQDFGYSTSLSSSGDTIAISDNYDYTNGNAAGKAEVYKWDGSSWTQLGQSVYGDTLNNQLGRSVSLSKNAKRFAVGAIGNSDIAQSSGQVKVFEYQDPTNYEDLSNTYEDIISIYPNPTKGIFSVDLNDLQNPVTLRLYNITGQLLQEKQYHKTNHINHEIHESPGVYFVEISDGKGNKSVFKLVKE
ncbi:T9SS type A sorting domain-containing protein [Salibacter halophilus]|uniref:T9SS type A sorting domain-containing protein n=1 Tax=Salibacter halophilus TaxID=1803916 RepID=A0A6N6M6M5_9FLAO|nr:T9SS type A sorting domain-containing protein [Salibacter halophilus]KAB1065562.1 T9SS type A sorting domain-containing protein [Salibacter halophilus]